MIAYILFGFILLAFFGRYLLRSSQPKVVIFLHPDLGIGGAERLVVDAAVGLQQKGYTVHIYTTYHDPKRCFPETVNGTLHVVVSGNWFPPHLFGRFHVLCVTIRMCWAALYLSVMGPRCQTYIVDQLATPVPLLRFIFGSVRPVLFYCHFPDKLCDPSVTTGRKRSVFHTLYRFLFDTIEGLTIASSHKVVFNSGFTKGTTLDTFPILREKVDKTLNDVLYPPINTDSLTLGPADVGKTFLPPHLSDATLITSINRFESKKNVELAVDAFHLLIQQFYNPDGTPKIGFENFPSKVHMVLAGGYDERVEDNRTYMEKLKKKSEALGLSKLITFRTSIPQGEKIELLQKSKAVLYTPTMEHFGIVPVEAMYFGTPVVAVNRCGPLESIAEDKVYGRLMDPTPEAFCEAIAGLLRDAKQRESIGKAAKRRCLDTFCLPAFATKLATTIEAMSSRK